MQYPGRESRFSEPRIESTTAMVQALADRWGEICGGGRCALYGHSMGALLGFELAVELARRGVPHQPRRLFLTGHEAPHLPYRAPKVHALPAAEFLPAIGTHFGGIPDELLQDRDIAELIATTLRSDFTLVETYAWQNSKPVHVPISAMGGINDPWATEAELAAWAQHTSGGFSLRMFPGDHFFNQTARGDVLAQIVSDLSAMPT